MFEYKNVYKQLIEVRNENAELAMKLDRTNADIEYIAMMTDVDLEETEVTENVE